jgi:hypothetical protein
MIVRKSAAAIELVIFLAKCGRGMKANLFGVVASILLFGAMPSQAASLIDQGNNTFDPNTGLQWLDVPLTAGLSYDNVLANYISAGGPYVGYRYATGQEVSTLFTDAGLINPQCCSFAQLVPPELALIALLGPTFNSGGETFTAGLNSDPFPSNPGFHSVGTLFVDVNAVGGTFQQAVVADFQGLNDNGTDAFIGSFLVRSSDQSTPLPAALPLFATALSALGLLGWRRKRKQAARTIWFCGRSASGGTQ